MKKRNKEPERRDSDDFAGIGIGVATLLMVVVSLMHPLQALKELLRVVRRLGRRAARLALAPFGLVALILWSRHRDRHPSFEDYLRRSDTDDDNR